MKEISKRSSPIFYFNFERQTIRAHIAEVLLNFCKGIFFSALYFDEDLGCAARFATSMKFAYSLLIVICSFY